MRTDTRHLVYAVVALIAAVSVRPAEAQEQQAPAARASAGSNVVLRPGDRVRLKVWREPDLSGDFVVNEEGIAVFPMVGRINVQRVSTDSLKTLLITLYTESIRSPSVEVTVLRKLVVTGAVRNPGLYYVDPTTTVGDALALSGGVTSEGRENRFELWRGGKVFPVDLRRDARLADSPLQPGDQLRVPERSWLSRNTGLVAGTFTSMAIIIAAKVR